MTDCIFCKIASGEIKSEFVYESGDIVAFNDIDPKAPVHILIIPRKHISTLDDLGSGDTELIGKIVLAATTIAKERKLDKGYRLVWNCNAEGGQAVYHIHLHLLGGRSMQWPPG